MSWIVLGVSDDMASLLLYRSLLELDGHNLLVAADTSEALKRSKGIAVDCVIVDCERNGISVIRAISRSRPEIPILFVSDQSEIQLQVYSETGMFVTKDEAIGELSRCVRELIQRNAYWGGEAGGRSNSTRRTKVEGRHLHEVLVRWLLPW